MYTCLSMTRTLSVTTARNNLLSLVDQADRLYSRFILTKNGESKAVLMSSSEFESWEETLHTLADRQAMKDIKESLLAIKKGKLLSYEAVVGRKQKK